MTCREGMTAEPVCCLPNESAAQVAKLMKTDNIGCVPICEDRRSKKLVGVITDRDLALKVVAEGRDPNRTLAQDLMTRKPVTCRAEDEWQTALDAMEKNQVRRIPVVDEKQQLIGIIAQADVAIRGGQPEKTAAVVEEISRPSLRAA
jgi:CBS domain-containing protein